MEEFLEIRQRMKSQGFEFEGNYPYSTREEKDAFYKRKSGIITIFDVETREQPAFDEQTGKRLEGQIALYVK